VAGRGVKGIEAVYNQYRYLKEIREALNAWADRLATLVKQENKNRT
jgi:hypothetical protein